MREPSRSELRESREGDGQQAEATAERRASGTTGFGRKATAPPCRALFRAALTPETTMTGIFARSSSACWVRRNCQPSIPGISMSSTMRQGRSPERSSRSASRPSRTATGTRPSLSRISQRTSRTSGSSSTTSTVVPGIRSPIDAAILADRNHPIQPIFSLPHREAFQKSGTRLALVGDDACSHRSVQTVPSLRRALPRPGRLLLPLLRGRFREASSRLSRSGEKAGRSDERRRTRPPAMVRQARQQTGARLPFFPFPAGLILRPTDEPRRQDFDIARPREAANVPALSSRD